MDSYIKVQSNRNAHKEKEQGEGEVKKNGEALVHIHSAS